MKNIKAGDIILFKPGGDLFSRIIAWGTKSSYSHVAVCVSPKMNLAIEANTKGGVRAIDLRSIKRDIDIYRVKEEYEFKLNGVISFLVKQLNNKYDLRGVMYLGALKLLAIILRKPLKNAANKWQKDKDYFCSELCYEAFSSGGLDIVPDVLDADITSPGDIAKSVVMKTVREY